MSFSDIPAIASEIRQEARRLHRVLGGAGFRAALAARDPEAAARLAEGDTQRLVRAYEVAAATGRPLAAWQRRQTRQPRYRHVLPLVLLPPRPALYAACDARFAAMVTKGGLDEAAALLERGLDPGLPALKAVGVPELFRALRRDVALDQAIAEAQQATRRYAKRQFTWFRHQLREAHFIDEQFSERFLPKIFPLIRQFLLTAQYRDLRVAPPR